MSLIQGLKRTKPLEGTDELPLVPLRDSLVFPQSVVSLYIVSKSSVAAIEEAMRAEKALFLSLELEERDDRPDSDVHSHGVVARILQRLKLSDGSSRILVEGLSRARAIRYHERGGFTIARLEAIPNDEAADQGLEARKRLVRESFASYAESCKKLGHEAITQVQRAEGAHQLVDAIGAALQCKARKKQALLEPEGANERLEACAALLDEEIEILSLQKRIQARVKGRIDKAQREYFLSEQLKEINRELGKEQDEPESAELERAIEAKGASPEAIERARKELAKLAKLQSFSPEAGVIRNYCEWIADLPWATRTIDTRDLKEAAKVLDEDHYGLAKVKERVLEFIAVRQLEARAKGPILCFVGPPGTGKTSLGASVARALGRNFTRFSLGGLRDEAEIRGHRRTYVGALPGKILQSMKKAGSANPVILLDEIDKMSSDYRGDPASALLEVLDPRQNSSFQDHYLELPYDLGEVMFIATANGLQGIPYPLLDRMEIIEVPGYSELEKLSIAKRFLLPRQLAENGLGACEIKVSDDAITEIIRHYTSESGVRGLEREIARLARKLACEAVEGGLALDPGKRAGFKRRIGLRSLGTYLGRPTRRDEELREASRPGLAYGLAYTEMGGVLIPVEVTSFGAEAELILTGKLGEVMRESARTALSFARSIGGRLGIEDKAFERGIHVHVPHGSIPKDGPSAGVTIVVALISCLLGKSVAPGVAMTGEISLGGDLLAIGGLKEKLLAAHRYGKRVIILPEANRCDIDDVPREVLDELDLRFLKSAHEALGVALGVSSRQLEECHSNGEEKP
jgi:ATP-dependent Lon protease